jgi:hypothetical protein
MKRTFEAAQAGTGKTHLEEQCCHTEIRSLGDKIISLSDIYRERKIDKSYSTGSVYLISLLPPLLLPLTVFD